MNILAAAGAMVLAAAAASGVAEAQCVWSGYTPACSPVPYPAQPYRGYEDPAFGYYRGRPSGAVAAFGAASHMVPEPRGGFRHACSTNTGHTD